MPKKTKHEKILASYRNKLKQSHTQLVIPASSSGTVQKTVQNFTPVLENKETNTIAKYFRQDFTKSLFLIVGIITLELIFYFVSMNSNLRSIFKFIP